MCSTIRPLQGAPGFRFVQVRHFRKVPTTGSHQNIIVTQLLTPTQRFEGLKRARLSAPFQGPTISVSRKEGFFGKP